MPYPFPAVTWNSLIQALEGQGARLIEIRENVNGSSRLRQFFERPFGPNRVRASVDIPDDRNGIVMPKNIGPILSRLRIPGAAIGLDLN